MEEESVYKALRSVAASKNVDSQSIGQPVFEVQQSHNPIFDDTGGTLRSVLC